ncbi:protein dscB [Aspergillus glaucus CBS 516.65]|uniref:Peptidase S54 rhomboid domain-containing protein n=1 Tax=Aspergillus glaucus CBS 516.65 TaxID=1160497 RepID=A0A1L9VEH7_ASPGL|nr:hypothetical protein ASPGLDRAFT_130746 [Aspergillus glaucus CBS 516.65]OJJ82222.1 hypothetical protein ASPGLDRAFT_130746 [Aspergillus glaucus CBS 516.65]
MYTSGLTNTPITKNLLIYTIASSILLSILDSKHLVSIYVSPHLWQYGQFWRAWIWQVAGFANSTEALFAAVLVYHLRVIERGWGRKKLLSFILSTLPYTTLLPPLLLALVIRPLSFNTINYLPSGPVTTLFALLAQYHALIPHTYRYRIGTSTSSTEPTSKGITLLLSNKSTTYLLALQLALSQFPYMLLPSVTGWFVGLAWRAEVLPGVGVNWRVPAWVVGEKERVSRGEEGRFEDLRRRLEGEVVAAGGAASGVSDGSGSGDNSEQRQRQRGA